MNPRLVGKCLRISFFSLALMLVADGVLQSPAQAASSLMIGEVSWAGSSLSSADEWLELWNNSAVTTSLAGYAIRGAASSDLSFQDSDVIPPYGTFVISNYADSDPKSVLAVPVQMVTTAVSLPNDKLKIELIAPDGGIVDTAGDGKTPPAGSSSPKLSMIRNGDGWASAATAEHLDAGAPDLATPGICDGCMLPMPIPEPVPEPIPEAIQQETATTTEAVAITETTSTPPEPLVGTSGTEITVEPVIEAAAEPAPPLDLRLRAVFPSPSEGKEWIELDALNASSLTNAIGWSLKDGSSTIFRFTNETVPNIVTDGMTWHIELASAHLNNSGDSVELIRPDGSVAERMTYPSTAKDKRWIKNSDRTAWIIDPPDAPPAQAPISPPPALDLPTIELPIATTTARVANTLVTPKATGGAATSRVTPKATGGAATGSLRKEFSKKIFAEGGKATGPVAKKKTTSTKKISPVITPTSFTDMSTLDSGIRVRLSGTVATTPGILAKQQFVIVSPEGYGLWIRASNHQPSPKLGERVQIVGTLMNNDDGIYVKMSTKDSWSVLPAKPNPEPRPVDLLDAGVDDAWSLVDATGTVTDVHGQTIELDLGGVTALAKIKAVTGYRAARIKKGDDLRVRGVLDLRGETPIILPSTSDDITLTAHPPKAQAAPQTFPDWLPFGAAGITIAVTEGAKRLRRVIRDRSLRNRLMANS